MRNVLGAAHLFYVVVLLKQKRALAGDVLVGAGGGTLLIRITIQNRLTLTLLLPFITAAELLFHFEEDVVRRGQPQLVESPDSFLQETLVFVV